MPSSYTSVVQDGRVTDFREFALRCSRAMGAAIMQRDDHPDAEIELRAVSGYLVEEVEKRRAELEAAQKLSHKEWEEKQRNAQKQAVTYRDKYLADREDVRTRYEVMLTKVREWTPPTGEHEGLKKFMIEQLQDSIRFDCGDYEPEVPELLPVSKYRLQEIGKLADLLGYATKSLAEEEARVKSQNEWVKALRDSL